MVFYLTTVTPDYSVFSRFRKKLGTKKLSIETLRNQMIEQMSAVFTFVDASHLISKASLWEERNKAIIKYVNLNNEILLKISNDEHAGIGCKGGSKFWYGYKKHVNVNTRKC